MSTSRRRRIRTHQHRHMVAQATQRRRRTGAHAERIDRSGVAPGKLGTWMAIAGIVLIVVLLILA